MKINFSSVLLSWIPIAVLATALSGLIYIVVQQNFRTEANDPQIQIAEDLAAKLTAGQDTKDLVSGDKIDIDKSLATFIIVYNDAYQPVFSTAVLNGETPVLPQGVFDFVKQSDIDMLTWQPKTNVRSAIVVERSKGTNPGYVLVGRSLREVENRESALTYEIMIGWFVTLIITLAGTTIAYYLLDSRKK